MQGPRLERFDKHTKVVPRHGVNKTRREDSNTALALVSLMHKQKFPRA